MDILLISKHSGLLKQFKVGNINFISITIALVVLLGFSIRRLLSWYKRRTKETT